MTSSTTSPFIYIIDAATTVCASIQHLLETAQHRVFPICNAESFYVELFQTQKIQYKDIVVINLEVNLTSNFRLLNLMMKQLDGPGILLLSKRGGAVKPTDRFSKSRIGVLQTPFDLQDIMRSIETVS